MEINDHSNPMFPLVPRCPLVHYDGDAALDDGDVLDAVAREEPAAVVYHLRHLGRAVQEQLHLLGGELHFAQLC